MFMSENFEVDLDVVQVKADIPMNYLQIKNLPAKIARVSH